MQAEPPARSTSLAEVRDCASGRIIFQPEHLRLEAGVFAGIKRRVTDETNPGGEGTVPGRGGFFLPDRQES